VDRFATLVGMPPIRYLTVWRLQTAKLNLRERRTPIAKLAHSVGYESEEAFSRAFKREFGMPPARWRGISSRGLDGMATARTVSVLVTGDKRDLLASSFSGVPRSPRSATFWSYTGGCRE
jgi:hypothetical protein